ncbi:hypothetical protein J5N97_019243 [Dioscorea zingiberensis]|uniref:Uncharacterized protein n=1 Tax=Dioscorea zingiberensis TaxID=325984 RepID=A0A9D5HCA8_9LILI|nr:hypothetical protein J5N97_019243 [Dioscorea zingiberensis]
MLNEKHKSYPGDASIHENHHVQVTVVFCLLKQHRNSRDKEFQGGGPKLHVQFKGICGHEKLHQVAREGRRSVCLRLFWAQSNIMCKSPTIHPIYWVLWYLLDDANKSVGVGWQNS